MSDPPENAQDASQPRNSCEQAIEDTNKPQFEILRGLSGEELEEIFRDMHHPTRIEYVRPSTRVIPRERWWALDQYVCTNDPERKQWGIGQRLVESLEGMPVCSDDGGIAEPWEFQRKHEESIESTQSESSEGSVGGGLSAGAKIDTTVRESETMSQTDRDTTGIKSVPTIYECGTYAADCRLNRRAFWKIGNFCLMTGSSNRDYIQSEVLRVKREKRVSDVS